nr:hypothetical protein Itr_chr04CG15920 [Ipomoea trifida]
MMHSRVENEPCRFEDEAQATSWKKVSKALSLPEGRRDEAQVLASCHVVCQVDVALPTKGAKAYFGATLFTNQGSFVTTTNVR